MGHLGPLTKHPPPQGRAPVLTTEVQAGTGGGWGRGCALEAVPGGTPAPTTRMVSVQRGGSAPRPRMSGDPRAGTGPWTPETPPSGRAGWLWGRGQSSSLPLLTLPPSACFPLPPKPPASPEGRLVYTAPTPTPSPTHGNRAARGTEGTQPPHPSKWVSRVGDMDMALETGAQDPRPASPQCPVPQSPVCTWAQLLNAPVLGGPSCPTPAPLLSRGPGNAL